ncbi:hypothetical protein ACROYT_G037069 [Oculina patagonica]
MAAGFFMFISGVTAMTKEIVHAAITSVPIQAGPILLVVAGILSLVVACIGIYFVWKKLTLDGNGKALLIAFMVLLVVAALLALVAGGLGISHRNKMESEFEGELKTKVLNYGRTGYETEANIDRLQKEDKCCGVNTYADWRATVYGGNRYDRVPDSCCKEHKYGCGFKFSDEATLNKKGCASIAIGKMESDLTIVGAGGLICGIIEAILFFGLLICYIKHDPENQEQGTRPQRVEASYKKTGTSSEHDDDGDDASGAQGGSASAGGPEDAGGEKASVHL